MKSQSLAPPTVKFQWPNVLVLLHNKHQIPSDQQLHLVNDPCARTDGRRRINSIPDDKFHWSTRPWLIYLSLWVVYLHLWDVACFEMQVTCECVFLSSYLCLIYTTEFEFPSLSRVVSLILCESVFSLIWPPCQGSPLILDERVGDVGFLWGLASRGRQMHRNTSMW